MSGAIHENDTNMVKRDGTLLDGAIDQHNAVNLPEEVLEVIENDDALSADNIKSTLKFTENSITYYEVDFILPNETTKTIIFDESGKIKSQD